MKQSQLVESLQDLYPVNSKTAKSLNGKCDYLAHALLVKISNTHAVSNIHQQSSLLLETNAIRHFQYMKSFMEIFDPFSFIEIFKWMLRTYENHGFPYEYWKVMLPESRKILKNELSAKNFRQIAQLYDWLLSYLDQVNELSLAEESYFEHITSSPPKGENKQQTDNSNEISTNYVNLLLQGKRSEAIDLILTNANSDIALEDIYLKVLQPAMYSIGKKWQTNEINIAVEHYCTAATQMLLAMLFPLCLESDKKNDKKMLGCCLGSELHELGMRMVSDFFEFAGWNTYFLGAVMPSDSLIETIKKEQPDIVCLSASMYFGVPQSREVIKMIKSIDSYTPPKVLVGGLAFNLNPELSKAVGADGFSKNASEAITIAEKLI